MLGEDEHTSRSIGDEEEDAMGCQGLQGLRALVQKKGFSASDSASPEQCTRCLKVQRMPSPLIYWLEELVISRTSEVKSNQNALKFRTIPRNYKPQSPIQFGRPSGPYILALPQRTR